MIAKSIRASYIIMILLFIAWIAALLYFDISNKYWLNKIVNVLPANNLCATILSIDGKIYTVVFEPETQPKGVSIYVSDSTGSVIVQLGGKKTYHMG